ncbi:septum site-determining protein DivIVA [bacterium BMS3Abin01]|nr:septum site-determining protein DivIVA [bacterium BMS3Abin01]HDY69998.1 DivIVA domain-containing protein [Actinomycetota bacterium]
MKITPLDIRHKEFSRSMRGYKDLEVDEYLDEIVEEFERLFNKNIDYQDRLEALEEKIEQYRNIEETLQKTLISAQEQAEELKVNAKKEADLILRDAELKSRSIINDSYAERQKIQRSVQSLKQRHEDLRYQLKSLLESYMNVLDQDDDSVLEDVEIEGMESGAGTADAVKETADEGMGIDQAVSTELAGGDAAEATDTVDGGMEAEAEEVSFPALHGGGTGDEDDPFADVEIDTDEKNFKW